MKHTRTLLAATLALTLAACGQQAQVTPGASAPDQTSTTYLVGFKESSLGAQSLSPEGLAAQAAVQAQAIQAAGGTLTSQWAEISAAAVQLTPQALATLKANPLVQYVEPEVERHALGRSRGATDANAAVPAATTQAAPLYTPNGEYTWGDMALKVPTLRTNNYIGSGVAVCVGDTGIDANHPEFAGKLKGYKNFILEEKNRENPYQLNDVSHHGTHVAGTIFAQYGAGTGAPLRLENMDPNGVGGVAPGVNLYVARVLGDTGSGSNVGVINGMFWCASKAKQLGGRESRMIISLSLGGGSPSASEQRAATLLSRLGILTVAATGNDATDEPHYPAAYDTILGVGAIDNNENLADFSNYGTQVDIVGPGVDVLSTVPLGQGTQAFANAGNMKFTEVQGADGSGKGTVTGTIVAAGGAGNQFCGTGTRNTALSGKIALISRGTCSFEEKTANAVASGAIGVIVYNNRPGVLGMSLTNQYNVPVVGIKQDEGLALMNQLPTTGTISVLPADYAYYNGTSMATPHVSAAAAVVWSARPHLTNVQLVDLLQRTAKDLGPAGRDNFFGHGLVDPLKAITGR